MLGKGVNGVVVSSVLSVAFFTTQAVSRGSEIVGSVIDESRKPMKGVIVLLFNSREDAMAVTGSYKGERTDADGQFHFSGKRDAGSYFVAIDRTGFGVNRSEKESVFRDYVFPREPVEIIIKQEAKPSKVEFILARGATITGRAITAHGDPIHPAIVGVSNGSNTGRIDKEGKFVVRGIPTGKEQRLLITPTKPPEYIYSRYVDVDGAKITAGATVDVGEIRFDPMPAQSNLLGTMTDGAGDPLEGLRIYQLHHTTLPITRALIVKEGKIDQKMLPGEYRVTGRIDERLIGTIVVPAEGSAEVRLTDPQAKPNPTDDASAR